MGWSLSLPFLPYGNRFRRQRRVMQRYFDAQAVDVFKPTQVERVQAFLGDLLQSPDDFREAIHRWLHGGSTARTSARLSTFITSLAFSISYFML